jgi:hypothetical protein
MAPKIVPIGTIVHQVHATSIDVQAAFREAMGYLNFGNSLAKYPIASEAMDRAVANARMLLRQLRKLRTAVGNVGPADIQKGRAQWPGSVRRFTT